MVFRPPQIIFLCCKESTLGRFRRGRVCRSRHRREGFGRASVSQQSLRSDLWCSATLWSTRAPQPCSLSSYGPAAACYSRNARRCSARGPHAPRCFHNLGRA
jgi:hypothetical protein